jgi:5-methylcytosine-specific restriction endonuclease McrA
MSVLNNSVLVLNKGWMPVDVTNVYDAVLKVCRHDPTAKFVDPETYVTYDFEAWVDTWEDAIRAAKFDADKVLESPCLAFRLPEVIVLTRYDGDGHARKSNRPPKFSRRNVYLRDRNTCQYCGRKCSTEESNLDHVIPKSKPYCGQMTWTNIVVACVPCNDKKRNRTPEEAGMRLIRKPVVPKPGELKRPWGEKLKRKLRGRVLPSWEHFLGKMYWEVGLKDD